MKKLRLSLVTLGVSAALFAGSGVAFAGMSWCDVGCPPPMEAGKVDNPGNNPHGMPTPMFHNANGKFVEVGVNQDGTIYLPPGNGLAK